MTDKTRPNDVAESAIAESAIAESAIAESAIAEWYEHPAECDCEDCDDRNGIAEFDDEKRRRIYYQDIVYSVCNSIDGVFPGTVVCGTVDAPSDEVEKRAKQICRALKAARHVVDTADQHGGLYPQYPELHDAVDDLRKALGR